MCTHGTERGTPTIGVQHRKMQRARGSNPPVGLFYLAGLLVLVMVSQPRAALQLFYQLEAIARLVVRYLLTVF